MLVIIVCLPILYFDFWILFCPGTEQILLNLHSKVHGACHTECLFCLLSDNRNCRKECLMFDKVVTVKKRPVHSDSTTELNHLYEVQ